MTMAQCRQPIEVTPKKGMTILAPCNKCAECLQRKKQQWIHRIECEKRYGSYKNCYMLGLSYDNAHLPYESYKRVANGVPQDVISTGESLLNPYDLRLFIERLRHLIPDGFTYFAVGEYGSEVNTHRPHFHILLFTNQNWRSLLSLSRCAWSYVRPESRAERYLREKQSKLIGKKIKRDKSLMTNRISFGNIKLTSYTYRRVCYVSKYVCKQFGLDEIVPPFYSSSKGLGKGFLNSHECKLLSVQNKHYAYMSNGKPTSISRYYSEKMFSKAQRDVFNLAMVIRESPPFELLENPTALKNWYYQQMCIEKAHRRARLMRFNGVLHS